MRYMIICHAHRTYGYGPFDSEAEARNHADKYLQDYRCEIQPYEAPHVFDGEEGTYSDAKCSTCPRSGE